ncbi:bifunctional hydroxymethylpyrimidine kinase/phosphomethylpyrimidine kinase [Allohahella marinimesophila]|uniref:hydroxymethylpyrimidine kinase n=1 Tax=Allohahella marinimesophila TaxID=1054972 RepID=A0ABP7P4H3_9GAMM
MSAGIDSSSVKAPVVKFTAESGQSAMPIALTIAGSDSGGGAGIQADLKTFSALGVYGASVLTATTAQNTRAVTDIHDLPEAHIRAQLEAVFDDLDVRAVKTGMLGRASVVLTVADALAGFLGEHRRIPLIIDPVMVAKSGDMLLARDAVTALVERLLPLATLVTPNLPEALTLLAAADPLQAERLEAQLRAAATESQLAEQLGVMARALAEAIGVPVLLKGGHLTEYSQALGTDVVMPVMDVLVEGPRVLAYQSERIMTNNTHGTGCTLSAAIAARLALGDDLAQAVEAARDYLHAAIAAADQLQVGSGHGPVHHFHATRGRR